MLESLDYPRQRYPRTFSVPYCDCLNRIKPRITQLAACKCGEEDNHVELEWESADDAGGSTVLVSEDARQVVFHPVYSAGTAVVRARSPLQPGRQYYWEVKMLSDVYGTDIMVGAGTRRVRTAGSLHQFTSLLGEDEESYGLSYTGRVQLAGRAAPAPGFCRGALVGVAVDTWRGTLQFYINRKPIDPGPVLLRRHNSPLYPMLSSTACQSVLRLTYAGSRPASLETEAARALHLVTPRTLPPGLRHLLQHRNFPPERQQTAGGDRRHTSLAAAARSTNARALPTLCADGVVRERRLVAHHQ